MGQHIRLNGTTKTALLLAATEVFGERGFDGASVRAITSRAGTNLGAVTYHFGSKAALFEAVLLRALDLLHDALEQAAARPGPALTRLEAVVTAHFHFVGHHPELRRLMLQVLIADRRIPETAVSSLRRVPALVGRLIAEGQLEGTIRRGDPRLLTVSVMAQPIMLNLLRPVLRLGPGINLDEPDVRATTLAGALRFIRAGLAPTVSES
jgi:AcrR family transcriptional regulator